MDAPHLPKTSVDRAKSLRRGAGGGKVGKRPHLPHVLATTLLYGRVPGISAFGNGRLHIEVAPLARHMNTSGYEIKRHLRRLEEWGMIRRMDMKKSSVVLWMQLPRCWEEDA